MDDYISRADAYFVLTDYYSHKTEMQHRNLQEALNRVPPADVRPVVYCRDCIYWKTYPSPAGDKKYCSVFDWINSSTGMDYCSFAERRGADMRPAPEPPAETPAQICQTCGNFETCPWQDDPNMAEYRQTTEGRVVACSEFKDTT